MISRRHLRIKVMQALYGYFQSKDKDMASFEKELNKSVEKLYDSYLLLFLFLSELSEISRIYAEDKLEKHIKVFMAPKTNTRFYDNSVLQIIIKDKAFEDICKRRKLTWNPETDVIKKIFNEVKESKAYISYCWKANSPFNEDLDFVYTILKDVLFDSQLFQDIMEEKSICWVDDSELVQGMILKTIKNFPENSLNIPLFPLFKEEDDKAFMSDLFRKTIINDKEFEEKISKKTINWDLDRIAQMDIILMKMALAELISFPEIPEKVTINEFLDIAKKYSTDGSSHFINGIIDKIKADYENEGLIVKSGKGLIDKLKLKKLKVTNKKKKYYK